MAAARKKSKGGNATNTGDPATSDRIYDDAETEFMMAMDKYKRDKGRPFPKWSEVLAVLKSLGYRKS